MKKILLIGNILLLLISPGCKDASRELSPGETPEVKATGMQIGISYYPERRPREMWNVDFELLVDAGIKRIRIGEFAWSTLEPEEDQYDFSCFDDCIELAQRYGLQVLMCTPTATPPVWLIEKHPEVLPVNADRQRNTFGARQHRCYNTPAYKHYSEIIVEKLAARYASHPNVVAWQIDNEMGGEQKRCYCDTCREKFQHYLAEEYGDVESLNRRWMNAFWSLDYQRFDQVVLPYRYNATLMLKHHPSLELEFSRFSSASIVNFSNMQAGVIRRHNSEALVTTNRSSYAWGDNVNAFELNRELDVAGFDLYTTKKYQVAFYADMNRSLNPEHNWFLEYGTDSPDLAGEMELLESRGVQWLYLFKLNPFPSGMEQSNRALLTITGKPTDNYRVVEKWNRAREEKILLKHIAPETGIYYDFDCSWAKSLEGWGSYTDKLVYQGYTIDTVYQALYTPGKPVRIFHQPGHFEEVKSLILPQQLIYSPELESSILHFMELGGTVITTHNLFLKNKDNVFLKETPPIYQKVMKRPGEFFYDPPKKPQEFTYQKGRLVIVPSDAGVDDWKKILETYQAS